MPLNDALSEKIARNPLRFGMIAGFLGIPLLWMAGDSLVRIVQGQGALPADSFWRYEASGAIIGAFLGGQGIRIWAAWREGNIAEARHLALITGGLGTVFYVGQAALYAEKSSLFWWAVAVRVLYLFIGHHLPFLLCVLLILGGLFSPRR
ncbi:hypothetical protein EON83_09090 [bacterium]|nr:MAG: hypothetical protein EON83_09090 [bacterium]